MPLIVAVAALITLCLALAMLLRTQEQQRTGWMEASILDDNSSVANELLAPWSGAACVWYQHSVDIQDDNGDWNVLFSEEWKAGLIEWYIGKERSEATADHFNQVATISTRTYSAYPQSIPSDLPPLSMAWVESLRDHDHLGARWRWTERLATHGAHAECTVKQIGFLRRVTLSALGLHIGITLAWIAQLLF